MRYVADIAELTQLLLSNSGLGLGKLYKNSDQLSFESLDPIKIRLTGLLKGRQDLFSDLGKIFKVEFEDGNRSVFTNENFAAIPDLEFLSTDTGFDEDISMISYLMSADLFGFGEKKGRQWISHYMDEPDKKKRISMLQELHKNMLLELRVVPLVSYPYVAVARKPWKINLSKLYANNQFWLITQ